MSATSLQNVDLSPQMKPRVLIADDSRVIRMAIKRILGTEYDLVEVGDGASAWDSIREDGSIQALVTDIEMPNVDGYELICRLRGSDESRLQEMPVIAITGAEDDATKQRAFACGATDFIIKPIDAIQLRARVQAYVRYDQAVREQTAKNINLEEQAVADNTTGLCSRRYLSQRGVEEMAFCKRRGHDLSLIRIDLDHFKKLYKTHGDDISEDLLTWFSRLLLTSARTEDTVARISGVEFAILANSTSIENAKALCQRLQESLANQPYRNGKSTIPVTLSIGLASLRQDRRDSFEDLLKLAQQRLCHAQSEGGDRLCSSVLENADVIEEVLAPSIELVSDDLPPVAEIPLESGSVDTGTPDGSSLELMSDFEGSLDLVGIPENPPEANTVDSLSALDPEGGMPGLDEGRDFEIQLDTPAGSDSITLMDTDVGMSDSDDTISVDRALQDLMQGQTERLIPNLDAVMRRLKPLLEFSANFRRH